MERKELDFVLAYNHYLEGGTKEACVKVRDFLHHNSYLIIYIIFNKLHLTKSNYLCIINIGNEKPQTWLP